MSIVMDSDAICVGDTAHTTLQDATLVNTAFDQLALHLDAVIETQEYLECFRRRDRLDLRGANIFATQENARVTVQQDALSGIDDSSTQVDTSLNGRGTHVVKCTG